MICKKILIYLLLILIASQLQAQHKRKVEKSVIYIQNIETHKTKIIYEKSKIRYWQNNQDKCEKGRIEEVKDSSIIINETEIKLNDLRKIGVRKRGTIPLAITIVLTSPLTYFVSLLLLAAVITPNSNMDLTKNWRFIKTFKPVIDSSRLKKFDIEEKRQNDSSSSISFTLNPLNCFFNQYTLEGSYQINKHYSIGLGGGIVKANYWWNHKFYDGADESYPAGVYNGWLMNFNFKSLNFTKDHWYFETSLFYKYLYYDHVHFYNGFGDPDPDVQWIRSEIANVYGIKFLMGKRIYLTNHFSLEPVFGISFRERSRSYITYWSNHLSSEHMHDPWGILLGHR